MIRVDRPATVPPILLSRGAEARNEMCAAYDADSTAYNDGTKKFTVSSDIYGHAQVKSALLAAQHGKCAFCEAKVTHVAYGDIEHFRPKAGWIQTAGDDLQRPGYYWLAYEWTNLLFCCQLCNQQGKKNHFPLSRPASRARSHNDDLAKERPLLINPADEDPEAHIGFRQEVAFYRPRSRKGKASIAVLGLNRPALVEQRRDHLKPIKVLEDLQIVLQRRIEEAGNDPPADLVQQMANIQQVLTEAQLPRSQYAAMVRSNLTGT